MSELEYKMKCPKCKKIVIMLFSGSGTKGTCMKCGYNLPPKKSYLDYVGNVISYNG
jgi:hypothetical protein